MNTQLSITHTPAAGTRLTGAARTGAIAEILTAAGWVARGATWHLPRSVDHTPRHHTIQGTITRLSLAGIEVTLEIEEPPTESKVARIPDDMLALERRVATLEAQRRKLVRALNGHTNQRGQQIPAAAASRRPGIQRSLADVDRELVLCRERAAALVADGAAAGIQQSDVKKGDEVKHRGVWLRVVRATRRAVMAQSPLGGHQRLEYATLEAVRTPVASTRGERARA